MGLISRRFRFLQNLFPPGGALPPQPGFIEESISPVHQVLSGTERLDEEIANFVNGAAGVLVVNSTVVPVEKFWYVFSTSMSHDDPTARSGTISIQKSGVSPAIVDLPDLLTNKRYPAPGPFVLPPGMSIRWELTALAGTKSIQGQWVYLELDIGDSTPRV